MSGTEVSDDLSATSTPIMFMSPESSVKKIKIVSAELLKRLGIEGKKRFTKTPIRCDSTRKRFIRIPRILSPRKPATPSIFRAMRGPPKLIVTYKESTNK
ncbi:unnamed protein product [Blepharisma stoltei]|uniref:Uncharacterized protein n=1 Tax=Blepharisma stoltei TaxID=1481888 RepID=A0AAU9JZK4_9CILI|nr:unnamed protein product [Blepharisma stoltei]